MADSNIENLAMYDFILNAFSILLVHDDVDLEIIYHSWIDKQHLLTIFTAHASTYRMVGLIIQIASSVAALVILTATMSKTTT